MKDRSSTRHSSSPFVKKRIRRARRRRRPLLEAAGDGRHEEVQGRGTTHSGTQPWRYTAKPMAGAKAMARMVDRPPVADALGAPRLRDDVGHVGRRGRQQPRPEDAVEEHQAQHQPVVGDDGVGQREHREGQAAADEHAPLAHPVGQGARHGRGEGGGVGQEPQEQPRRERAPAQGEDPVGRRGQELEGGEEDREGEPAHHEEARGEQLVGLDGVKEVSWTGLRKNGPV